MTKEKKCTVCGKPFIPDVRRPDQYVCLSPECQKQRQLNNMKQWRANKAASAGGASWKESCRHKSLEWRKKHKAYLKLYREEHKEERNEYMKEYMRQYRKRGRADNKKGDADKTGSPL